MLPIFEKKNLKLSRKISGLGYNFPVGKPLVSADSPPPSPTHQAAGQSVSADLLI
jgi:hypothetical protein